MSDTNNLRPNLAFWALTSAFLVDFLGYAFIVPILPEWQAQFDLSNTQATALVSLWAVPLFILGPYTGRLTDRYGPGRVILASVIMLSITSLVYLVATREIFGNAFILLAMARLLHGLSGAAIVTAGFAASSILWPNNFGEQSGKLLGVAMIGGLLGPAVGGFAFAWGQDLAFLILAGLNALAIPLVAYAWRDIDGGKFADRSTVQSIEKVPLRMFFDNPVLFRIGTLVFLTTLVTGALEAGGPLFLAAEPLSLSVEWIGATILLMVLLQGIGSWWWGRLVDKKGPVRYMIMGWIGVCIGLFGSSIILRGDSSDLIMVYSAIALLALFQFSVAAAQVPVLPMIDTATCQAYGRGGAGLAFGAAGTAWAAGTIVGPIIVGIMLDLSGSWSVTFAALATPCLIGLFITMYYGDILRECYFSEMENRANEE